MSAMGYAHYALLIDFLLALSPAGALKTAARGFLLSERMVPSKTPGPSAYYDLGSGLCTSPGLNKSSTDHYVYHNSGADKCAQLCSRDPECTGYSANLWNCMTWKMPDIVGGSKQSWNGAHCIVKQHVNNDLIFDLGFNQGGDALSYLGRGFRVVGVEADPQLVNKAKVNAHFTGSLHSAALRIDNRAISGASGPYALPFFRFGGRDDGIWGSVGAPHPKCKECKNCCYKSGEIQTISCDNLLLQYGVPVYMKIDIEGADLDCIRSISLKRPAAALPRFISFERSWAEDVTDAVRHLRCLGYTKFKTTKQASGPFGNAAVNSSTLSNEWRTFDVTINDDYIACKSPEWCDIHAMRDDEPPTVKPDFCK